jgi:diadenosine tetraphosphatase ApaH/serine/threonine PP2A family protein phosphatase
MMCDRLWSDPKPHKVCEPNKRSVGDVTNRFLQESNLALVVRFHEVQEEVTMQAMDTSISVAFG